MSAKKIAKAVFIAACTIIGVAAVWIIPNMLAEKDMKDVWQEGGEINEKEN